MATGKDLIRAGPGYLGTPYSQMDCQAFVEACLKDCGIRMNLAGSNAWYREVMQNGWVGTPAECKSKYGSIPPGAFLFILKSDGKEPAKYQGDGIGNAIHIGIYTGMTGSEMCAMSGKPDAEKFNFGNGAINSSNSRGYVCTSKFLGKEISGGWNRIGMWNRIDYGGSGEEEEMAEYQAKVINGTLNMRTAPDRKAGLILQIPDGSIVDVTDNSGGWSKIQYKGFKGYAMSEYLERIDGGTDGTIQVQRKELQEIYDKIGKMLKG